MCLGITSRDWLATARAPDPPARAESRYSTPSSNPPSRTHAKMAVRNNTDSSHRSPRPLRPPSSRSVTARSATSNDADNRLTTLAMYPRSPGVRRKNNHRKQYGNRNTRTRDPHSAARGKQIPSIAQGFHSENPHRRVVPSKDWKSALKEAISEAPTEESPGGMIWNAYG